MSGYADLQQEALDALELRQHRRRRILSGIRGRLRESHSPRLAAAGIFLASLLPGVVAASLAVELGLSVWGPAPALCFFVQWPVFILLMDWQSGRWIVRGEVLRAPELAIPVDEAFQALENHRLYSEKEKEDTPLRRAIWQGAGRGLGQSGFAALPLLLILGCLTLGTWLVWELLRISPTLFSEIILDGRVARRQPELAERVELENWKNNAFAGTAVYFLGLALIAGMAGAILLSMHPSH